MFARLVAAIAVSGTLLAAGGLLLVFVGYARNTSDRKRSENDIRQIGFGLFHSAVPGEKIVPDVRNYFPAGALPNPKLEPGGRIGWPSTVVLALDRSAKDFNPEDFRPDETTGLTALWSSIEVGKAWDDGANRTACQRRISALQAVGNTRPKTEAGFATSNYVGNLGLRKAGDEPRHFDANLRGPFDWNATTPFAAIRDGLEATIAFAETNRGVGPWLQAEATLRAWNADETNFFNPADGIGGLYAEGAYVGMAAGQFRFLTARIDPRVFRSLLTIDGSENID